MAFIEGVDRCQPIFSDFFILDNVISTDNPVRAIDAFVDSLDLNALCFNLSSGKNPGQKPYKTIDLVKIHLYSFFNKIGSSRKTELECHRNIELMWLVNNITPDHSTISSFFKTNSTAMKNIFKEFNKLCIKLELFNFKIFAVDGTKIKASNSIKNSFTPKKLEDALEHINTKISEYQQGIDDATSDEDINDFSNKLELIKQRKYKYDALLKDLQENNISEKNLVDPDCKVMNNHGKTEPCYNIQTVVDSKNHLILNSEATNNANDVGLLKPMIDSTINEYDLSEYVNNPDIANVTVIADAGYFKTADILDLKANNINPIVPKPNTSNSTSNKDFSKDKFTYNTNEDIYICPMKKKLTYLRSSKETRKGVTSHYKIYFCSDCSSCPNSSKCTTSAQGRSIKRNINESEIDSIRLDLKANSKAYRLRKALVEHPFGTIKFTNGNYFTHFRGKKMVSTWASCALLSYNFIRVIHILGVNNLINAIVGA